MLPSRDTDLNGIPLWTPRQWIFGLDERGFGGERGRSTSVALPDRPRCRGALPTLPQQALLYLLWDRHPLHLDPEFAAAAGLPRPIFTGCAATECCARLSIATFLTAMSAGWARAAHRLSGGSAMAKLAWLSLSLAGWVLNRRGPSAVLPVVVRCLSLSDEGGPSPPS